MSPEGNAGLWQLSVINQLQCINELRFKKETNALYLNCRPHKVGINLLVT